MRLLKLIPLFLGSLALAQPADERIAFTFLNATQGPSRATPAFVTIIGRDASGRFCHLTRDGQFQPCMPGDATAARGRRSGCRYGLPLAEVMALDVPRSLRVDSGRIYLSVGAGAWLGLDPATGALVEPDPANPDDPNAELDYDWIEFTLDDRGFHGNTTCVDRFGLPVTLTVVDRERPGQPQGPVGLAESRTALLRAWEAEVPAPFRQLESDGHRRILAPSHVPALAGGGHFDAYVKTLWARYRTEPLVLTPDEGTFTGQVQPDDRLVFTRAGDPGTYAIARPPSTAEIFLCNGVLAQGSALEKVLGAQLAAILNRHVADPSHWRQPQDYYLTTPCNVYARFWHAHSLDGLAYAFPYDDVNNQSPSLATPNPQEIRISFRWD